MNAWPFVIAAYSIVAVASTVLTITSWRSMKSAELRADEVGRR